MYWVGVYLGLGILTSATMPTTKNLHGEEIGGVDPWLRVLMGLLWPLYYALRFINRR